MKIKKIQKLSSQPNIYFLNTYERFMLVFDLLENTFLANTSSFDPVKNDLFFSNLLVQCT
jgi:hypothetical protein